VLTAPAGTHTAYVDWFQQCWEVSLNFDSSNVLDDGSLIVQTLQMQDNVDPSNCKESFFSCW